MIKLAVQKQTWNVLKHKDIKLSSGYTLNLDLRESSTGKQGLALYNRRFFLPIDREDFDDVLSALINFKTEIAAVQREL